MSDPIGGIILPAEKLIEMLSPTDVVGLAFKVVDFNQTVELISYHVKKDAQNHLSMHIIQTWPIRGHGPNDTKGIDCKDHNVSGAMNNFIYEFKGQKQAFEFCYFSRGLLQQMLDAGDGRDLVISGCHLNFGTMHTTSNTFTDFGLKIGYREEDQEKEFIRSIGFPNFFIGCTCPPGWGPGPSNTSNQFLWDKIMTAWNNK